jgi:hypothetical protein
MQATPPEIAIDIQSDGPCPQSTSPTTSVALDLAIQASQEIQLQRLAIDDDHSFDWMIRNITIDNESLLRAPGDLPGDMFDTNAINEFVTFPLIKAGQRVVLSICYIGEDAGGRNFRGRLLGTDPKPEGV